METSFVSRPDATSHDDEPCTVSVPETAELFAAAGLPRTERAIQRFCKKGELKCAFVETPFGSKYLITRSSIDRLIIQKKQAQKFAPDATGRDLSGPDATGRDESRQDDRNVEETVAAEPDREPRQPVRGRDSEPRPVATPTPDAKDQIIEKLRGENFDLKVDNAGKQNFIRQLVVDREQLMGEVRQISYELGAAQTRVAQLEAPKATDDLSRHVATPVAEAPTEATSTRSTSPAPQEPAPPPRRSWWRW